jgi:hypothetical protein
MGKGVFIWSKKGQVAPFLISIIVILLIATMALVNIGKVGTYRVNTSNAADAGAVAGVSMIASTQNAIADANAGDGLFNIGMLQGISLMDAYTMLLGLFFIPLPLQTESVKYNVYLGYSVSLFTNYLNLLYMGYRGMQNAKAQAHQLAFSNAQVEEVTNVETTGPGVYRPVKSNFEQWIENQDLEGDSFTYSWRQYSFQPQQGQQVQEAAANWVRSDVQPPSENSLLPIPMPAAPLVNTYWLWIPPCTIDGCGACAAAASYYYTKMAQINGAESLASKAKTEGAMQMSIHGTTLAVTATAGSAANVVITTLKTAAGIPLVQAFTIVPPVCGATAWMMVLYWVPVPFIVAMWPNDASMGINVTRYEPASDLGLFTNRADEVRSGARATTYGGSVFSPHSYRIRLESTW